MAKLLKKIIANPSTLQDPAKDGFTRKLTGDPVKDFIAKHKVEKVGDANGNGDNHFQATNIKKAPHPRADEEVLDELSKKTLGSYVKKAEQIDEISDKTLKSYIPKARASFDKLRDKQRVNVKKADTKANEKEWNSLEQKAGKRHDGIEKAKRKIKFRDYRNEEVEVIDEHWYTHSRHPMGWKVLQGAGVHGGEWMAHSKGEKKKFKSEAQAKDHIHASLSANEETEVQWLGESHLTQATDLAKSWASKAAKTYYVIKHGRGDYGIASHDSMQAHHSNWHDVKIHSAHHPSEEDVKKKYKPLRHYREETEQLDEISVKKADAYRGKAFDAAKKAMNSGDKKTEAKRDKGRAIAFDKVTKRAKVNATEETINELSSKTLGSYVKKAAQSMGDHQADGTLLQKQRTKLRREPAHRAKLAHHQKKYEQREKGIAGALKRITKEETEINEISKKLVKSYIHKATGDLVHADSKTGNFRKLKRIHGRRTGVNRAHAKGMGDGVVVPAKD